MQKINEMGGAGLATAKFIPGAKVVRGFNAIGFAKLAPNAAKTDGKLGVPIAGDDKGAIALAEALITQIGFEAGAGRRAGDGQVPGARQHPSTLGEHTPDEIKQIAATLKV